MTTNNQLQPGRKLDESIAKAMGWKYDNGVWGYLDHTCSAFLPQWSTNRNDAMDLLEELCRPVEDGGRGWRGYRTWHNSHDVEFPDGVVVTDAAYNDYCSTSRASLAHAISLAILAALEAEK